MAGTDIGIDLGTTSVLVYVRGRGVVLKEPSVAALDRSDDRIRAIGEDARMLLSRSPGTLKEIHPLENGIIADYVVTEQMLRYFIQKAVGRLSFRKPKICICVPADLTEEQLRDVYAAYVVRHKLSAKYFTEQVRAAAAPILTGEPDRGPESGTVNIITTSAIIGGFARLLSEKLLLLDDKSLEDVAPAETAPPEQK